MGFKLKSIDKVLRPSKFGSLLTVLDPFGAPLHQGIQAVYKRNRKKVGLSHLFKNYMGLNSNDYNTAYSSGYSPRTLSQLTGGH